MSPFGELRCLLLIGMPGAGKTSCGRALSGQTGYPFADSDDFIEKATGRSIADIFATSGEPYFRKLERHLIESLRRLVEDSGSSLQELNILDQLLGDFVQNAKRHGGLILATGGGLPCQAGNFEILASIGITVHLSCPPETLASRLAGDTVRPLLSRSAASVREKDSSLNRIRELLAERLDFYEKAAITVDTSLSSVEDVAASVRLAVERAEKV
ncbi:MAG: shikimate kinase [Candidatus Melainabacteria bacterium]|nr:shikimate kinase [Candidatus Melainabacteria bacterium]